MTGREGDEESRASTISYLRRQVLLACVRANADSLLTLLLQVGEPGTGAAQAANRRSQALGREEKGRRERAAHWLLSIRGNRGLQGGHFMLD